MRTALRPIGTIRTRASGIREGADSVAEEADELQLQVNDALLARGKTGCPYLTREGCVRAFPDL